MIQDAVAAPPLDSVQWGQGAYGFELRSTDAGVLTRAADVFKPWTASPAPASVRRWTILPGETANAWRLLSEHGPEVSVTGDAARAVMVVEYRALEILLTETVDILTLHAALIARGEQGVLVLGPCESGKSTLACALWRHGFSLLGDDVAIVDPVTAEARSAPRRVSLRLPSRALLGDTLWAQMLAAPSTEPTADGYVFHPYELDARPRPSVVRVAACIFLARRGVQVTPGTLPKLSPADAMLALLPYSNLIRSLDMGTVIDRVAPLAAAVPAYDLSRAPLPDMIAIIERLLDGDI
jgi:hypothetical protein